MPIQRTILGLWLIVGLAGLPAVGQTQDSDEKSIFDFGDDEMDQKPPKPARPTPQQQQQPASRQPATKPPGAINSLQDIPAELKQPAPAGAELNAERKRVVETFPDLNSPNAMTRSRAMSQARALARDMSTPPVQRYALFDVTREIAEKAGQSAMVSVTIAEMERQFAIDALAMQLAAIGRMDGTVEPHGLARLCLFAAERALTTGRLEEMSSALARIDGLTSKLPKEQADAVRQSKQTLERLLPHLATLKQQPDDPAANLAVGWHRAIVRRGWSVGLPMLAKGADATIKSLAARELLAPMDTAEQMEIANGWWEIGQGASLSREERASILAHAAGWYGRARPNLQGMQAVLADKRIKEAADARVIVSVKPAAPASIAPEPESAPEAFKPAKLDEYGGHGLLCEIFNDRILQTKVAERIDHRIDAYFGLGTPATGVNPDAFSIRWSGYVRAPRAGVYTFITRADDGVRLWIDEKQVIDAWDSNNEQKAIVELTGKPQKIRCEYNDKGGDAGIVLQWRSGESKADFTIGEQYFFTTEQSAAKSSFSPVVPGNGEGLQMTVFRDQQLRQSMGSRVDRQISSFMRDAPIAEGFPVDDFSVRWQGYLVAPSPGTYKLIADVDDGVRIYVSRKLVMEEWQRPGRREVTIELPDAPVELTVEFRERGGPGRIVLSWEQINGFKQQIIPPNAFYRTRDAATRAIASGRTK